MHDYTYIHTYIYKYKYKQGIHWDTVEIPVKVSEKNDFFPAFWAEKHIIFQPYHEFWYEIPAIENVVPLFSQSI